MKEVDTSVIKNKCIISISLLFLIAAITLLVTENIKKQIPYEIAYEYVNIKDMAAAKVATKKDDTNILTTITTKKRTTPTPVEQIEFPVRNNTIPTLEAPKPIWYLPVENGVITQYPSYSHAALDITSYRGSNEVIHPVANGTISGIYTDGAGAKIVTIHHLVDGINYTSQYVHLSSYAPDIYVGKPVTINDSIGQMGTTGYSTGIHLHIAVLDCTLFDPNDNKCSNLGGFFRYASERYSQGFYGLGSLINVPNSWNSR